MSSGISVHGNTASAGATQINNVTNNFGLPDEDAQAAQQCHRIFKTSTYEEFKNRNPVRIEGTCQWVLDHSQYRRWRQSQHNDLLWISADPGCGKSVLARSLVDQDLERGPSLVVCHFFFKDNEEQDNISTALCALLHQLFQQCPRLIHHALSAYKHNGEMVRQETREMWRILLDAASDSSAPSIIYVLDALDECRDKDRALLVSLLQDVLRPPSRVSAPTTLKVLVTSRPYSDIEKGFRPSLSCWPEIRLRGEDENEQIHREIDLVAAMYVQELADEFELSHASRERLEEQVLGMQHRTYLWLYLAMDEVRATYESCPYPDEVAIDTLPAPVGEAYERILQKIDRRQVDIARQVLLIITGARRPLRVTEMALALSAARAYREKSNMLISINASRLENQIRQWCGLFVYVQHGSLFLIHQTAKEFLLADIAEFQECTSRWSGSFTRTQIELEMAKLCTKYLIAVQPPLSGRRRRMDTGDVDVSTRQDRTDSVDPRTEFWDYCAQFWSSYCDDQFISADSTLFDAVLVLYDISSDLFKGWSEIWWTPMRSRRDLPVFTVQHLAAFNGHTSVLAHLDQLSSIDYTARGGEGENMLHRAAANGHVETVSWLLEKSVEVNIQDKHGTTALCYAAYAGHVGVVKLLLARPEVDINVNSGAYWYLSRLAREYQEVKLLLGHGIDLDGLRDEKTNGHRPPEAEVRREGLKPDSDEPLVTDTTKMRKMSRTDSGEVADSLDHH